MAVSNVGNEGWARMAAMMEVAKAKNPSLTGANAPASRAQPAAAVSAARPAETSKTLPANSPMVMRTYAASGVRPDAAAVPTKALGSRFDAYA